MGLCTPAQGKVQRVILRLLCQVGPEGRGTTDRCDATSLFLPQNRIGQLSSPTECLVLIVCYGHTGLSIIMLGSQHESPQDFYTVQKTLCVLSHLTLMAAYEVCIIATPSVREIEPLQQLKQHIHDDIKWLS